MIGDSLAADTESALPAALPGWHVRTDARVGRPLAEGMAHLRALPVAPDVLALSLFTNDDPRHLSELADAVRESVAGAALRHLGHDPPPRRWRFLLRGRQPAARSPASSAGAPHAARRVGR